MGCYGIERDGIARSWKGKPEGRDVEGKAACRWREQVDQQQLKEPLDREVYVLRENSARVI
jgi:hypothetical protein